MSKTKHNLRLFAIATGVLIATTGLAQNVKVVVDDQRVDFYGQGARMIGDRVVVPLRGVFEKLGASVDWRPEDQSILASRGSTEVWLQIGNREARINGTPVNLDQSALLIRGTTMVPLRFVSESLGADVKWHNALQTVYVRSSGTGLHSGGSNDNRDNDARWQELRLESGTVIPLVLETPLNSRTAREGDRFTAKVDTKGGADYQGIPRGTIVQGKVGYVKAMSGDEPGALTLDYDALVTPAGGRIPIEGSLIALDAKSVESRDGRIVARNKTSNNNQSVWIGAGAGAILAVVTKGNILTNTVIGAALGYLYDQVRKDSRAADVELDPGTTFGVKLDQTLVARIER